MEMEDKQTQKRKPREEEMRKVTRSREEDNTGTEEKI